MIYFKEDKPFYWLNEDSRIFLERGYLLPEDTPIDRIKAIAKYAEDKLEIEGFSDKFFYYMSKGYYSLSSPIWANYKKRIFLVLVLM